jgi:hypothetical protein
MVNRHAWVATSSAILALLFFLFNGTPVMGKTAAKGKATATTPTKVGKCTLPNGAIAADIATQLRLTGVQGEWAVSMETIGTASAGTWFINFTKNGVGEPSSQHQFNPPGGWAVVGSQIDKQDAERKYIFIAKATKRSDPIIVCEATISLMK